MLFTGRKFSENAGVFPFANVFLKIFSIVLALGKRLSCQYKGTLTIMVNVVRFMYKLYIMFQDPGFKT